MNSDMNPTDRRIERTKEAIFQSFLTLCGERGYNRLSVQDIAEHANIGRTTFYAHYTNKEDLLESCLAQLFHEIEQESPDPRDQIVPAYATFEHVASQQALADAFDLSFIGEKFQQKFAESARKQLRRRKITGKELEVMSNLIAGALASLLTWWTKGGRKYPPEEMGKLFYASISKFDAVLTPTTLTENSA